MAETVTLYSRDGQQITSASASTIQQLEAEGWKRTAWTAEEREAAAKAQKSAQAAAEKAALDAEKAAEELAKQEVVATENTRGVAVASAEEDDAKPARKASTASTSTTASKSAKSEK